MFMIKTQVLLRKSRKAAKKYSKFAPNDPQCNILQTLFGRQKYEEEMSHEQLHIVIFFVNKDLRDYLHK